MKKSTGKIIAGYVAVYRFKHSFGVQKIYIKYADDTAAIDLLLSKGMERQARLIASYSCNLFIDL